LLTAAAFSRVFGKAQRSRDKCFTVLCRSNDKGIARLGLAISKKNCKEAAGRNRLKRLTRESFRCSQEQLKGLDVVVINQPGARNSSNREIFDSLHGHWQRCAKAGDQGAEK